LIIKAAFPVQGPFPAFEAGAEAPVKGAAAFEPAAMPLGSAMFEPQLGANGERLIWVEERWLDRLNSIRRSGESYSETIIRLAALWEGHWTLKRR
jgi:hypothetical protein